MNSPKTPAAFPLGSKPVLVSGASGLVGRALVTRLEARGHEVFRLVRRELRTEREIRWDPETGMAPFPPGLFFQAVVHLAGENISAGRWTAQRKIAIRESRVRSTQMLVQALGRGAQPPPVWINASATGFYGERGEEMLTEQSAAGPGFLAGVCAAWEDAARAAEGWGARVVRLRTGVVLALEGGALAKLLPVFRAGLGGRLGTGRQWMSWITLPDLIDLVEHSLADDRMSGPINAVAPEPVTNAVFTATLARVLHRPAVLAVPRWVLQTVFGEMAEATLLGSARVLPARLQEWNHAFQHPRLEPALRAILEKVR